MNPTSWNWQGKTCFFWAGTNLCGLVWVGSPLVSSHIRPLTYEQTYFRLPEPKGLTYADLDVLFENHVSARKFRKVEVDPFRSDNLVIDENQEGVQHEELFTKEKY